MVVGPGLLLSFYVTIMIYIVVNQGGIMETVTGCVVLTELTSWVYILTNSQGAGAGILGRIGILGVIRNLREKGSGLPRPGFYQNIIHLNKEFDRKRLWAPQTRFLFKSNTC